MGLVILNPNSFFNPKVNTANALNAEKLTIKKLVNLSVFLFRIKISVINMQ